MSWIDNLKLNEVLAVIAVITALLSATTSIIIAKWNRRATVSEETLAILKQQLEISKQQAASTEIHLKEQLSYYKDLSPADVQKQISALKSMMTDRISELEQKLDISNSLLRERVKEQKEEKVAIATMMGYGRIFLGINDAEIFARSLTALISNYGHVIDFGEADLSVKSFYVGLMRLLVKNDAFLEEFTSHAPEWILDFLILPLLACMKYKTLHRAIADILEHIFEKLKNSPFAKELPIYKEALQRAQDGHDFSNLSLPDDLLLKLT